MAPMRFPPFLLLVLIALIVFGGFELLFKLALIAGLFLFFGRFFGFGHWGYPGHPKGRHGRFGRHGHGRGHHGHHRHPHGPYGRRGWGGWNWDDSETSDTVRPKQKNVPQDDESVDAEAWV